MSATKSGLIYIPKKNIDETNESFMKRKKIIALLKPKNKKNYEHAIVLSNIYVNMLYLKVVYNSEITKEVQQLIHNNSN